jgi:Ca2+-binding RTX toxin-like protein
MQSQADAVMAARAGGRGSFQFSSGTAGSQEMRAVFDDVADARTHLAINRLNALGASGFTASSWSQELIALTSLVYNGGAGIIQSKLANAIRDDNRPAAWYEIAFNSNKNSVFGLQNRRMQEAATFGLYPTVDGAPSVTEDSSRNVYRVFGTQGIANALAKVKSLWHTDGAGNRTSQIQQSEFDAFKAQLFADLTPAHDVIVATWGQTYGISDVPVDGILVDSADPRLNPTHSEFLNATKVSDLGVEQSVNNILIAEGGADYLLGGKGNDVLVGGAGRDRYYFRTGDGQDVIIDSDGWNQDPGELFRNNQKIALGIKEDANTWKSKGTDGATTTFTRSINGFDLEITFSGAESAGDKITVKNFDFDHAGADYLGIRLIDAPDATAPSTTNTIQGDQHPQDFNPPNNEHRVDVLGNTVTDGTPEPDRADTLYDSAGNDTISAGGGGDTINLIRGGNDYVDGGAGNDTVTASASGQAYVLGGEGLDKVFTAGGEDWLEGGAGADILAAEGGDDVIYAGSSDSGAVTIATAVAAGEIAGPVSGAGDLLSGNEGDDILFGANTADLLLGGSGEDILIGGGGNDNIYGDDYLVAADRGWAQTRTVTNNVYTVSSSNVVATGGASGGMDVIYGGAGDDWIFAGAGDDAAEGGSGEDVIFGELGNDVLSGGAGNDVLSGDATGAPGGDDFLDGGDDGDQLFGLAGNDVLYGGSGNDFLYGGEGEDVLYGGPGVDVLAGGAGKDTYVFNRGDGLEVIDDTPAGTDDPEASVLVLGAGIERQDIRFRLGSLLVDLGGGDAIHFNGFDADHPLATPMLDGIQFADGTSMTYQDVLDQGFDLDGTEGDDVITGTVVSDRIDAGAGNDTVYAKAGDDALLGGDGDDTLDAGGGNDTLDGGEGDDQLYGSAGEDRLDGGDGNDSLNGGLGADELAGGLGDDQLAGEDGDDFLDGGAGDDALKGGSGADTLGGGTGDDTLTGADGADVYVFSAGDGDDTIDERGLIARDFADPSTDVIRFDATVQSTDIVLKRTSKGDLEIHYGDDAVTVSGQYSVKGNAVERIDFADGSSISKPALDALEIAPIVGTADSDGLVGTEGDDRILGLDDMDFIDGGPGGWSVSEPTGNDTLEGGAGPDYYAMYVGMGRDTIIDTSPSPEDQGTLYLSNALAPDWLRTRRVHDDLFVGIQGTGDGVLIKDYYDGQEHYWTVLGPYNEVLLSDIIDRADPSEVVALSAMEDYRQGLLAQWNSVSSSFPTLPTHALVRDDYSQTVTYTLNPTDFRLPGTTTVGSPSSSRSILGFGIQQSGAIEPSGQPSYSTVYVEELDLQSNASNIQATGEAHYFFNTENYSFSILPALFLGAKLNVSGSVSPTQLNTTYSSTVSSWHSIRIDSGPEDGVLQILHTNELRIIERITGGADANRITGGFGPNHALLVDAGDGNDIVNVGTASFVYAGEGDDRVFGGAIAYGGSGDDLLSGTAVEAHGGEGDDTLQGGAGVMAGDAGDDYLMGSSGAQRYILRPDEAGVDLIKDIGGITREEFANYYYISLGIENPEESAVHGGRWGVIGQSGTLIQHIQGAEAPPGLSGTATPDAFFRNTFWAYGDGGDFHSMTYPDLAALRQDLAAFGIPYTGADIRYIEPLPSVPDVRSNDFAALQPLYDAGVIEQDSVDFGPGVTLDDLELSWGHAVVDMGGFSDNGAPRDHVTLDITYGQATVSIVIPRFDDLIGSGVEQFRFDDGTVISLRELIALAPPAPPFEPILLGTEDDDELEGTEVDDTIRALGGDDAVFGYGGNDHLDGGPGDDELFGGAGDDVIDGGAGDDYLYGQGGSNTLVGGPGDDVLVGGGDNTYVFSVGDGWDSIENSVGNDTIRFSAGVSPDDISVTWDPAYGDLYLVNGQTGDTIDVYDWFYNSDTRIETVAFADGTTWNTSELESRVQSLSATAFGDVLTGGSGDDAIDGRGGDDYIYGAAGNDVLEGGVGDDYVEGDQGNNLLSGGDGDDEFFSGIEISRNLYIGGADDDGYFLGDAIDGNVLAINAGDGDDRVDIFSGESYVVSLGGVSASDIVLSRTGNGSVRIAFGTGASLTSFNTDAGNQPQAVLQIVSSDIRTYDLDAVISSFLDSGVEAGWSAADALDQNLLGVSTTEAWGGDIAYRYAVEGSYAGLGAEAIQAVLADEMFALAPQAITPVVSNRSPVLANPLSDRTVNEDASFGFVVPADAFSDPDAGDTLTYAATLADGSDLPGWLAFDAQTRAFSGTPAQADVGSLEVRVTATDGGGASAQDVFVLDVANVNDAPSVTASNRTVLLGQSADAASLFSVADEDGEAMAGYEFWDSTEGAGRFEVGGVAQGVNVTIAVTAAELAQTRFVAASEPAQDQVWVRANDGTAWSDWKSWTMNSWPHPTNASPVITAANAAVLRNQAVDAATLFSVLDGDGDAITQYEFWDDIDNANEGGGFFSLDGVSQDDNPIPVSAAQLAGLQYVGGASPGTEQVWVRANDGLAWGAWKAWSMTTALHVPNAAPEVTTSATQTVTLGAAVDAGSLFSVADADGDPVARYEFWDSTAGAGRFEVAGVAQGVNTAIGVDAADLADVRFVGAAQAGSDTLWVRASDGQNFGDWKSWTMNSWPHPTNAAPVADAANATVITHQAVAAGTLFSVADADGDAIAAYEFWDDANGGGYFSVGGVQQGAAQAISVAAADLAGTQYTGGGSGGTERVWVRANDGLAWGAWKSWNMTTALHVPNAAPVVTAGNQTMLLGQTAAAGSLFSVTDADADAITAYEFWDSTAGNGHFTVNGVEQTVNTAIAVAAADLEDTAFAASQSAGSDQVWVRANDGQEWSDWKSWTMNSWPHATNAAPVVSASTQGLLRNEAVDAGALFSVADADGDAATSYEFWDDVNGGGHFSVNGVQQAAAQSIAVSAADLAHTQYVGAANAGTEQVWARASDGLAWGAWKSWLMSTEGGMLRGGAGPDTITAGPDDTVLEGNGGDDTITAGDGNTLISAGSGSDAAAGGVGNDLIAGGAGDDTVETGAGSNVVAFNQGDGSDQVFSDGGASNTLSLGNGIGYDDLSLSRNGNDLILNAGTSDNLVLKDWYDGHDTVEKLQLILDGMDYDAGSADELHNKRVQSFDFAGLVSEFDAAQAASPGLTSWALTNALLDFHLSGSDDAALGGDLAYWYARNGGFTGIGLNSAQASIGAPGFGSDAQSLHAFSGLQEGLVKLS